MIVKNRMTLRDKSWFTLGIIIGSLAYLTIGVVYFYRKKVEKEIVYVVREDAVKAEAKQNQENVLDIIKLWNVSLTEIRKARGELPGFGGKYGR